MMNLTVAMTMNFLRSSTGINSLMGETLLSSGWSFDHPLLFFNVVKTLSVHG